MPYTPINARKNYDGFGRIEIDDATPDVEIADIKNPTELSGSVGNSGKNNRRDVAKIEMLLHQAGALDLKQTDGPTGYWGIRTSEATKKVQADNGLMVDAEIKPDGPTIRKLREATVTRDAAKRRKEHREQRQTEAVAAGKKNAIDQIKQSADQFMHDATRWHFEDREAKNNPLPNSMRRADRAGFEMYPQWQNADHQNDLGFPEVKYVHPDGREVIYDGDTRKVVTDPEIKGTFNYVNTPPFDAEKANLKDWLEFMTKGLAHGILDYLPYRGLGNARDK